jgi:hypothetical protein
MDPNRDIFWPGVEFSYCCFQWNNISEDNGYYCLKIQLFWDVTLCRSVFLAVSADRRVFIVSVKQTKNWRWRHYCPSGLRDLHARRHSVVHQKICVFHSTAVKTSNIFSLCKANFVTLCLCLNFRRTDGHWNSSIVTFSNLLNSWMCGAVTSPFGFIFWTHTKWKVFD